MGRQRQLTVYDNTEVASGVRDGDSSAEQQDVVAVDTDQSVLNSDPTRLDLDSDLDLDRIRTPTVTLTPRPVN